MTTALGIWEVAARLVSTSPCAALVVASAPSEVFAVAAQLQIELGGLLEADVKLLRNPTAAEFEQVFPSGTASVVFGVDSRDPALWKSLDVARSRLRPHGVVAIVVSTVTAKLAALAAPNLASWFAGATYAVAPLKDFEIDSREILASLSERFGMDSDEAIRRATMGEPPSLEPEFAIWLVLLGRGDLVGTGKT